MADQLWSLQQDKRSAANQKLLKQYFEDGYAAEATVGEIHKMARIKTQKQHS